MSNQGTNIKLEAGLEQLTKTLSAEMLDFSLYVVKSHLDLEDFWCLLGSPESASLTSVAALCLEHSPGR